MLNIVVLWKWSRKRSVQLGKLQRLKTVQAIALCDIVDYFAHMDRKGMTMATKLTQARLAKRSPPRRSNAILEDARRAGLLDGDKTEHLSFRAPPALIEAARRESGVNSPTELGILALATLAQPDPVATFFKRTHGTLGETHTLDY